MGERRGTKGLELWCRRMTEGYPGVAVNNMTTSWRDGLAFCAIIHHFRPDLIDFSKLNKDDIYYNNDLAFQIAERHLGIPALLEPEDMVEFPVPDRLSILTYLSQYYRAFGVAQGSPSRTPTKRPSNNTSDRGIVSPTPTSPTSKMPRHSGGVSRREPCAKCALPVFIAERLNVGKQLYHRTCFRCARCNSQLTLANYYETETKNQFCCETCPDEELKEDTTEPIQSPMLSRSLSDEEKFAGLQKFDDLDEYSADFETALESANSETLPKTFNSTENEEYTKARSFFISSQLNDSDDDRSSVDEDPPELPKSDPRELSLNKSSDTEQDSGYIVNNKDSDEIINSVHCETFNKNTPCISSLDLVVNSINNVSEIDEENQPETANEQLGTDKIVTKENKFQENKSESTTTSLVKSRMLLFEKKEAVDESSNVPSTLSPEKKFIPETPPEKQQIFTGSPNNKIDLDNVESDSSVNVSLVNVNRDSYENIQKDDSCIVISSDDSPIILDSTSSVTTTNNSSNLVNKSNEDYPEDLNPFGDDEEDSKEVDDQNTSTSLNPFDGDDDEEEEDDKGKSLSSPKPAVRKKLKIKYKSSNEKNLNITTGHLDEIRIKRISYNPFDEQDDKSELESTVDKKVIPAPRISLNPFWSDGEEPDETVDVKKEKPVPLPRNSRSSVDTPEPKPRKSGLLISNTTFGSNTSISSARSSLGPTLRKKKPAPKPPVMDKQDSAHASPISSPSASVQHSPKSTPKLRKSKKAPQPPSTTSTPYLSNKNKSSNQLDISPIDDSPNKTESLDKSENSQNSDEWETEKIMKDEVNRNRQSQLITNSLSDNNLSMAAPNKSTYGKWKRRKGPAPSRPIPERRHIKPLPVAEIKRELEFIEIQQQGLEKQGVRLEQIIREKCEGPDSDLDSSLTPEVEDLILQLFELVNEKNELFRKQTELMYLRRQQRLEEEYADLEYQIRCLMLQPEANKTDSNKAMEEELINRLIEVVERRNEIVEVLEMDRVREAEEDDSINNQLNLYALKREDSPCTKSSLEEPKQKKKNKKEKKFKFKSNKKLDIDKDIDESESTSSFPMKEKKKKKFGIF